MLFILLLWFNLINCEDGDLGYSLNIGNAIDLFANYGDLSQVAQVVSSDNEEEEVEQSYNEPFREKNIRIFKSIKRKEINNYELDDNMSIQFCDTIDDLLDAYFYGFKIEGTNKPWKAFMGDWVIEGILRTLGLLYDNDLQTGCCYVLAKMSKSSSKVYVQDKLKDAELKDYVKRAISELDPNDVGDLRAFMKNYGSHYIQSYTRGDVIYQVFRYKKHGYNLLKAYIKRHGLSKDDNLRFYFSSFFLRQVGDIRVASGNYTIEQWAKINLRDSQYLYSRPSLLRLYYNPILVYKVNLMLQDKALIELDLRTLKPIFDDYIGAKFDEVVKNDLLLWEINT